MTTYYPPGHTGPLDVGLFDPEEVGVFGFDWTDWLAKYSVATVDESKWEVSAGALLGDGITPVTFKGITTTPGAPMLATPETTCHVYLDTAVAGDVIVLTNHIRAGQLQVDRSMQFTVQER